MHVQIEGGAVSTEKKLFLVDEYGNVHYLTKELARGGQGVVFRTSDNDLAIKQPLDANDNVDKDADLRKTFQKVRTLELPPGIPLSLPLALLRDEPGYVMRLLNATKPPRYFFFYHINTLFSI